MDMLVGSLVVCLKLVFSGLGSSVGWKWCCMRNVGWDLCRI
jgi:hypothetical protein